MFFYKAKLATAARHTDLTKKTKRLRHKHKTQHTKPSFIPFPFGFLSAFAGEMLIKNHQLCKSSFVSSPVVVWQFVPSAVPVFLCLLFLVRFSAGIFAGWVVVIHHCQVSAFISFLLVGISGAFRQVVASLQHCPFRVVLKRKMLRHQAKHFNRKNEQRLCYFNNRKRVKSTIFQGVLNAVYFLEELNCKQKQACT
jgi:hypothetical protein